MLIEAILLWSYSLTALMFGLLSAWALRRSSVGLPPVALSVALMLTAVWALAVAGIGVGDLVTRLAEGGRNIAWLVFLLTAQKRSSSAVPSTLVALHAVTITVILASLMLFLAADIVPAQSTVALFDGAAMMLRLMTVLTSLLLLLKFYPQQERLSARLVLVALGALWLIDTNVDVAQLIAGDNAVEIEAMRGLAANLIAGGIGLALHRRDDRQMQVSRTVTLQSLTILGVLLYLMLLVVGSALIATFGGGYSRLLQAGFIIGATTALFTLASSPWLRAWAKVMLTKHLFRHRYDYRAEWLRFTETLGRPDAPESLEQRSVKVIADLVQSPGGILLICDQDELAVGANWNWPDVAMPQLSDTGTLAAHLIETGRVIELDSIRNGDTASADALACPRGILGYSDAWAIVPLPHFDRLAGAILLARPPIDRQLDWEDFDLLKIAGRQVASYLAESRATSQLMEAQRFDEFNRRFAFILHDIKNLVSQLTLVARNAERHADNPDFRADMVATLKESASRMNELLAKLSVQGRPRAEVMRAVDLLPLIERIADHRRHQHPVIVTGDETPVVMADPKRLEQVLSHLVQNAVEASQDHQPVTLSAHDLGDGNIAIDVVDQGCGMAPVFIRDQLFRPFASSKPNGFGIGAFEARALTQSMGGEIEVNSREGKGSRFRIVLKSANPGLAINNIEEAA